MSEPRRAALSLISLWAVASGLTSAITRRRRRRRDFRVFILEYHDVSTNSKEREGTISCARLRRHLRFLKRRYRPATLCRAAVRLQNASGLSEDLIVVTFDDGYAGNFAAAWPVLTEEDFPATIFLTTGFLDGSELWFDFAHRALRAAGREWRQLPDDLRNRLLETLGGRPSPRSSASAVDRLKKMQSGDRDRLLDALREANLHLEPAAEPLSWHEVREMQAGGAEMGGHTISHPILPSLSRELQEREIRGCQERIAQETSEIPASFAFPNGDHNATTLEILNRLGFTAACTTRTGSNRPPCNPLTLRRIGVGRDPTWVLAARLSGLFDDEVRRLLRRRLLHLN